MLNDLGPEQTRTDCAIIEDDLEAIYARLAKIPMRSETLKLALSDVGAVLLALLLIR